MSQHTINTLPGKPTAAMEYIIEAIKASEKFRAELVSKSPEEIAALVEDERLKEAHEVAHEEAEWARREEAGRFFNVAMARADFDYWSKAAYWTLDEAVALSFGRNPNIVSWNKLKSYVLGSPFASTYQQRLELAERAKKMGQLFDPVLPGFFIGWARRLELDFPHELENLLKTRGVSIGDWQALYKEEGAAHLKTIQEYGTKTEELMTWFEGQQSELIATYQAAIQERDARIQELTSQLESAVRSPPDKPLSQKERESLQKIIIALAIDGLGYQPNATRSPTAGEIAGAVLRLGLEIDEDTVRTHLKAAAQLLPQDLTERDKP